MNETYFDLPRLASDIYDIVYGLGAEDITDIHGRILVWLNSMDLEHKNIFMLALGWRITEGSLE
jgi:hypothetical protein